MRLNARNAHLIIFLVVILSSKVLGQSTFGSIVGTVKDSSGSVVPMANVKFANEGTAVERTVSTDRSGSYVLTNVEPGVYDATIETAGFQTRTIPAIELRARQTIRVDATLEVSPVQESITISIDGKESEASASRRR